MWGLCYWFTKKSSLKWSPLRTSQDRESMATKSTLWVGCCFLHVTRFIDPIATPLLCFHSLHLHFRVEWTKILNDRIFLTLPFNESAAMLRMQRARRKRIHFRRKILLLRLEGILMNSEETFFQTSMQFWWKAKQCWWIDIYPTSFSLQIKMCSLLPNDLDIERGVHVYAWHPHPLAVSGRMTPESLKTDSI